jgi:hypothetical protein
MNRDIPIALRSLSRARQILMALITSSESFDYRGAKEALNEMQLIIRDLAREEARLRVEAGIEGQQTSANILRFPQHNSVQRP